MDLETLKIDLDRLDDGLTQLSFDLDDSFFEAVEAPDVQKGNVHVDIDVVRAEDDFFNLSFHGTGNVIVPCDRCLDDMEQPISFEQQLNAKFGKENSEDDDLVTVAEDEGILDVSWLIYEFIDLAIPIRHVHAPGKCNPAMIRALNEHSAARSGEEGETSVDPRWAALNKLNFKN